MEYHITFGGECQRFFPFESTLVDTFVYTRSSLFSSLIPSVFPEEFMKIFIFGSIDSPCILCYSVTIILCSFPAFAV